MASNEPEIVPTVVKCSGCGSDQQEHGFLYDTSEGASSCWVKADVGEAIWKVGLRISGRDSRIVHSFRCSRCGKLELFADELMSRGPEVPHVMDKAFKGCASVILFCFLALAASSTLVAIFIFAAVLE